MFNEIKSWIGAMVFAAVVTMAGTVLPSPAAADAPIGDVLKACSRTAGCWSETSPCPEGKCNIIGCSPKTCFSCSQTSGLCHSLPKSDVVKNNPTKPTTGDASAAGNAKGAAQSLRAAHKVKPVVASHRVALTRIATRSGHHGH
jgi:hypothetical protein